jgi:hypothetical protein
MERSGWIEKDRPACCPGDAVVKPLALAPCTSDIHTVWEGARGTTPSWGTRRSGWWTRWETKSGTSSQVIGSSYRRSPPTGRRRPHSAGIPRRPGAARRMEVFAEFFHINLTDYNLAHLLEVCPWRRGSCSRTCSVPGLWAPRTLTSGSGRSGCPQLPVQE